MQAFPWFGSSEAKQFGAALAEDLGRRFPPASMARTDAGAKQQLRGIVEGIAVLAAKYCIEKRVGMFGKAALANGFRWKLIELGYEKDVAEQITSEVAQRMAVN